MGADATKAALAAQQSSYLLQDEVKSASHPVPAPKAAAATKQPVLEVRSKPKLHKNLLHLAPLDDGLTVLESTKRLPKLRRNAQETEKELRELEAKVGQKALHRAILLKESKTKKKTKKQRMSGDIEPDASDDGDKDDDDDDDDDDDNSSDDEL